MSNNERLSIEDLENAIADLSPDLTPADRLRHAAARNHLLMLRRIEEIEVALAAIQIRVEEMRRQIEVTRGPIERALAFLAPVIAGATPPLDGAQIATRAMLDSQITLLSRTLHDVIERVHRDVAVRMDVLRTADGENFRELQEADAEIVRGMDRRLAEAFRPRRLLERLLGFGK